MTVMLEHDARASGRASEIGDAQAHATHVTHARTHADEETSSLPGSNAPRAGGLKEFLESATPQQRFELLCALVIGDSELVRSAQGSHLFGGAWDPGIVSVRDLAAALGIEPNGPPPPPTEAELQEMRDMLAEVRSDRALAAAADAPQPEPPKKCEHGRAKPHPMLDRFGVYTGPDCPGPSPAVLPQPETETQR